MTNFINARKKKLPVGIDRFDKIRTENFYWIDKTGLIRELLEGWGEVNLITRPRRFGKSLNMSMLQCFFEYGTDPALFRGLSIASEQELCAQFMGRFPVIFISLKGVNGQDFETARAMLCSAIGTEALRFQFLLESGRLSEPDKNLYRHLITFDQNGYALSDAVLLASLQTLTALLHKHYQQKVILLIDEYDVPLAKAFEGGYYDEMAMLIRILFEQGLKSNDHLYFAVLTGCLRIAKENIFTGLNNLEILSVTTPRLDEYFGFTDPEVKQLLEYYGLSDFYPVVHDWYDGYHFGNTDIYCPWDVICYCDALMADRETQPEAYWSNTSGNEIIRHFLEMANSSAKREIEALIAGESIQKELRQELTYKELYDSIENVWSILFSTGYLTLKKPADTPAQELVIPNTEIRNIFKSQILTWFQDSARRDGRTLNAFCEAFHQGNAQEAERLFQAYLRRTISIRDASARRKENFYHGILVGLLSFKETWSVFSNHEAGDGYSDILVEIDEDGVGIVIEVKYAGDGDLDGACRTALSQIADRRYEEPLLDMGMEKIFRFGIACHKKRCRVMVQK